MCKSHRLGMLILWRIETSYKKWIVKNIEIEIAKILM